MAPKGIPPLNQRNTDRYPSVNRQCDRGEEGYFSTCNVNITSAPRRLTESASVFVTESDQEIQGPDLYEIIFTYIKALILIISQHATLIERMVTVHTPHTAHLTSQSNAYLIWRHKEKCTPGTAYLMSQ